VADAFSSTTSGAGSLFSFGFFPLFSPLYMGKRPFHVNEEAHKGTHSSEGMREGMNLQHYFVE